jgi:hypothetical protein
MSPVNYKFQFNFTNPAGGEASTTYTSFYGVMEVDSAGTILSMRVQNTLAGPLSSNVLLPTQTVSGRTSDVICQISAPAPDAGIHPYARSQANYDGTVMQLNFSPANSGVLFGAGFVHSTLSPQPDYWLLHTTIPATGEGLLHLYYHTGSTWTEVVSIDTHVQMNVTDAVNPACFIEGTKLLAHIKDKDTYVKIEDLRTGDLVKTHLHGYKPIKFIGKGRMTNNPEQWNGCVRKLPKSADMIDDLFVTGAHSILVDSLSEKEKEGMLAIYGTTDRKIDDKTLVLSWVSDNFEAVDDNTDYTYYHLVLEHDNDHEKRYGIWANGVLTESQSEKHFFKKPYELL